ncbi:MAG: hypothetical protein RMJ13_00425 [Elusimicrobiota bacterium]|nr:hypothetical protein [Elusimicrobiota bacterium]
MVFSANKVMIHKIVSIILTLLIFTQPLPPIGTLAGTKIYNGGDNGMAGIADVDGDTILTYNTGIAEGSYTYSNITEVIVSTGFAVAPLRIITSPVYVFIGEKNYIFYEVCNLGNAMDKFLIEITTSLPAGWDVYLIKDENKNLIPDNNESSVFTTIDIPPDTTYYFFITIKLSSNVIYGTSADITLVVRNQAGVGVDDGWYDKDTQVTTFTAVAILPEVQTNIPVPTGLQVINSTDGIRLSWDIIEYNNLLGFLIYKADNIEELCRLSPREYYFFTSTTTFVDNLVRKTEVWYKVKTVDKDFNLSEDSMFISSGGKLVSVYYENKILSILSTSQSNKVLYRKTNNINANLHIKLIKLNLENSSTDLTFFKVECFKNGVLLEKIDNVIDLNSAETQLGLYYDINTVKTKTGEENLQLVSMFYHNGVEWVNIGGAPVGEYFVKNIHFNGKYKLSVVPKTKSFEIISISPKKFYSPLESPPFDKVRFVIKHRKTVKPVGKIYDITGTEIRNLNPDVAQERDEFTTTEFHWDGKDNSGKPVRSGIYIYQFESNDGVINGTIIVVK